MLQAKIHSTAWISLAACCLPALASAGQGISLVGAWSGDSPAQGGMEHHTLSFGQDGTYVSVEQYPNGSVQRIWGVYSASAQSETQMTVVAQRRGWLPHQICAQAPGFAAKCRAYTPPNEKVSLTLSFTSASSFEVNGATLTRDDAPYLLQQQVAGKLLLHVAAPVKPNIAQPVARPGIRYQSPGNTGGSGCDNMQQNRICTVNDGRIVIENGCEVCVSP